MRLTKRRVLVGVFALIVLSLVAYAITPSVRFLVAVVVFTRKWARQAEQAQNHLFLETDYQELLAACRSLSKRVAAGELRSGQYQVYLGKRDPETLSFPQVILDLRPAEVLTNFHGYGEVLIVLFPGPEWLGITGFPEGTEGHGAVKLIEGLWYFDNGYGEDDPKYMARINDMVEKGRQRRASRAAAPTQAPQQR
jgi:hypothetical protein